MNATKTILLCVAAAACTAAGCGKARDSGAGSCRVLLPAVRGRILDRNGVVLADNRPNPCIAFHVEEMRAAGSLSNTVNRIDEEIDRTAVFLGRVREVSRKDVERHIETSRPIPLVAFRDLTDRELAHFLEWNDPPSGAKVFTRIARVYPEKDLACHVIGYVGRGEPKPPPGDNPDGFVPFRFEYFLYGLEGRSGIERTGDAALAGRSGLDTVFTDTAGFKCGVRNEIEPEPGRDVVLTLDADLQRAAENALGTNRAAAVVLDVRNGDVLALATAPRYDLSRFTPAVPADYWAALSADPKSPFLNRAASGRYAPGGIVEPAVALAALRAGSIRPDEKLHCDGKYSFGTDAQGREIAIHCTERHGDLDVSEALAVSCNPFFNETGIRLGWDTGLRAAYDALGFGRAPRIGIPVGEGLLPDRHGWIPRDTANVAMGQGDLLVTPLQVAVMTMALANRGTLVQPRLVRDPGTGVVQDARVEVGRMDWNERDMDVVRDGMRDTVRTPRGTGSLAAVDGLDVAGATGTAHYRTKVDGAWALRKHAWMIAYAPADAPQYALAVLVEDAPNGGGDACPIVRELLLRLFPEFADAPITANDQGNEP